MSQDNTVSLQTKTIANEKKIERHPGNSNEVIYYFNDKKYESSTSNLKMSLFQTFLLAFNNYNNNIISQNLTKEIMLNLDQLSKNSSQKITFYFEKENNGSYFVCYASLLEFVGCGSASSKNEARDKAIYEIFQKISNKNLQEIQITNQLHSKKYIYPDNSNFVINPRDYQHEIFQMGVKSNIIACLGTGTGKTLIAVLLIRKFSKMEMNGFSVKNHIVFLVPTIALAYQQSNYILRHTKLSVGCYCGTNNLNIWSKTGVAEEINQYKVLVMTGEAFRKLLQHNHIRIENLSLLIFDECHRGFDSRYPFNIIMTVFYHHAKTKNQKLPRIIGLTASPTGDINFDGYVYDDIREKISSLEKIYDAKCVTSVEYSDSLKNRLANPKIQIVSYVENLTFFKINSISAKILAHREKLHLFFKNYETKRPKLDPIKISTTELGKTSASVDYEPTHKGERIIESCLKAFINANKIYIELGIYGLLVFLTSLQKVILNVLGCEQYYVYTDIFNQFMENVTEIKQLVEKKVYDILNLLEEKTILKLCETELFSNKVKALMKLLCKHYQTDVNKKDVLPSSIVFSSKIATTSVLSILFEEISLIEAKYLGKDPRFSCNFVVGITNCNHLKTISDGIFKMLPVKLKLILQSFNDQVFNILFCTKVLEEGIDVKACNIVVRFDSFHSFRSFVQSKGRIRKDHSYFYIIESQQNSYIATSRINNFLLNEPVIDSFIKDNCFNLQPVKTSFNYFPTIPLDNQRLYTLTSIMDIRSAVAFVYHYCKKFTKNKEITNFPKFLVESSINKTRYSFKFPDEMNIKQTIYSEWSHGANSGRILCAMNVVKHLYEQKLINDDFLPISPIKNIKETDDNPKSEFIEINNLAEILTKTNITKGFTPKTFENLFYCYFVDWSKVESPESTVNDADYINFNSFDIAFLVPQNSNAILLSSFLCVESLPVTISDHEKLPLELTDSGLQMIKKFNKAVFDHFFCTKPSKCSWESNSNHCMLYIAVLNDKKSIDYDRMKTFIPLQDFDRDKENHSL